MAFQRKGKERQATIYCFKQSSLSIWDPHFNRLPRGEYNVNKTMHANLVLADQPLLCFLNIGIQETEQEIFMNSVFPYVYTAY